MTELKLWMMGTLASHARGKVITQAAEAVAIESLPEDFGLCLAFGSDFQNLGSDDQQAWTSWAAVAGRALLLVPPFNIAECQNPVAWRAFRPQKPEATAADGLGKLLANEVKFEIAGPLQTAVEVVGEWKGGGVHTAYYRKHPHSGLFALTCLPIWSLTILDHRTTFQNWLQTIGALAGAPNRSPVPESHDSVFQPSLNHFAVMLSLCERLHDSKEAALEYLLESHVFAIPQEAARACLDELEHAGLSSHGRLTEQGRTTLLNSKYAVYASAMERNS